MTFGESARADVAIRAAARAVNVNLMTKPHCFATEYKESVHLAFHNSVERSIARSFAYEHVQTLT